MAIFDSKIKTGLSWAAESYAIFKAAPSKWMLVSIAYLAFFLLLPSIKGLQFLSYLAALTWPIALVITMTLFRNHDMKKQQNLAQIIANIKPKMTLLIALGAACLLYALGVSLLLQADIESVVKLIPKNAEMTEAQALMVMQKMLPLMAKLFLLLTPMLLATWYAPMLIVFNNYPLVKSVKSSIAGSLQYFVAMLVTCVAVFAALFLLIILAGLPIGIISTLVPAMGKMLSTFFVFGCMIFGTSIMLAFQYVSYRDVFRAA
jgi:hypothetical protein